MIKVANAKDMQQIDRDTIRKYGISGAVLMERAGLAVVSKINELLFAANGPSLRSEASETRQRRVNRQQVKVIVLCGGGNNGGDGFVIARVLHNQGINVEVYLSADSHDLKGDARINYIAARKFGVKMVPARKFLKLQSSYFTPNVLIVDALLGTGLKKDVRSPLRDIINKINRVSSIVISVDISSGISSDTGQIMGSAVKAHVTVTFGLPKKGHIQYPGAEYTGKLFIEDIGFPGKLLDSEKLNVNLLQRDDASLLLPERQKFSHKGSFGHVLLVAGSRGKTGAAFMAAKACLRSGAGLVTVGIPETLVRNFQSRVTEEMILPLADKGDGTLSQSAADRISEFIKRRASVLAIGPGISADKEISRLIEKVISRVSIPIIIDADGLNALSLGRASFKKSRSPVILTPHPGEMARLLRSGRIAAGVKREREMLKLIEEDRIDTALQYAKKSGTYLVLKGVPTIIATPGGNAYVNPTGNSGMASAGTGDVLTGMISGFIAQGLGPLNASLLGVYVHGLAGDVMAEKKGEHSLIASDMIKAIPNVLKSVRSVPSV
jgi:NAD(P)H-hydrate epimerase